MGPRQRQVQGMGALQSDTVRVELSFTLQGVILMADSCDACGYKNAGVKGTGSISERGRRITLHVTEADDLRRDVIKAETASVLSLAPRLCKQNQRSFTSHYVADMS